MARLFISSFVSGAVAAGDLAITWNDCGSATSHGHITDVHPTVISIGGDGSMTGTGTVDKEITGGSFSIVAGAYGVTQKYSGLACEAKTFKIPLGLGTVTWGGLDCPVAPGNLTQTVTFTTAAIIPSSLARVDISSSAVDQDGEEVNCLHTHLDPTSLEDTVTAGDLAITWNDCGSATSHGHITEVHPTVISIGGDGSMTGTGTIDKEITGGSFSIVAGAYGVTQKYTGLACEAKTFKIPLGLGTVTWGGLACPVAPGNLTQTVTFTTAAIIPSSLARVDISSTAVDQDGEEVNCLHTHLDPSAISISV